MSCIDKDDEGSEKLSVEAGEKEDFSIRHIANSSRGVIKQNKDKFSKLEEEEVELQKEKKQMTLTFLNFVC